MKKIILLITCLFLLTGCFDYQELSDMSIIDGIGFDYKDGEYQVILETIKSTTSGESNTTSTNVVTAKDKVLANALNKAVNNAGKKVSLKHVKLLLLSKSVSLKGIDEIIDYIIRDVNISTNLYTIVCDNPQEVFDTKIEDDSISNLIVDTITYNVDAKSLDNIDIIASNIINDKIDIALPFIHIKDKNIVVDKIAYFNGGKYVDKIDSKIYNFLLLDSNNIDFDYDDTVLNIFAKDIKYDIEKNQITINISGSAKVKEVNKKYNLKELKTYEEIEKEINKTIEQETYDFLKETLSNKSDLIGLRNKYYKKFRKDRENINYVVKANIKINRNGAIYEVLYD